MSKIVKTKEQVESIMKMMDYRLKRKKGRFPKIMIDRTSLYSYKVMGYRELGEGEEIVNVCDSYDMDSTFFMNNVIGEVAEFLGINENACERLYYRYKYD